MAFCPLLIGVIGLAKDVAGQIAEVKTAEEMARQLHDIQAKTKELEDKYGAVTDGANQMHDRLDNWSEILIQMRDLEDCIRRFQDFLPLVTPPGDGRNAPLSGIRAQNEAKPILADLKEIVERLRATGLTALEKGERNTVQQLLDSIHSTVQKIENPGLRLLEWREVGFLLGDLRGYVGGVQGTAWEAFAAKAVTRKPVLTPG